ncbi:Fic family protein [Desulforamulus ruminis]|uniref:Filamentation induced by cAMP protein Fic n=1 Tax=Desulforamulus ruminis (strain ATCC 23193 / DSM 2154 / NCIMB 8452 / DL) TaxID=696281 RepID=F6DSI5_DESRL|nr:Fic family protein [Desulforamulus ruminis]AEG61075.1 filamentation induced by cAMP protein Fic [Desulforamulus ruminis DSM 2154]
MIDNKKLSPDSAASPRPGNKPFYIKPNCRKCGAELVLLDTFWNPDKPQEEIWHDEFICPVCEDGIYMDWPEESEMEFKNIELFERIDKKKKLLDDSRPLPPEVVENLREYLLIDWTYNSNAIEGNTLTLLETKVVLEGITIGGKSLREHFEVINHKEAVLYVEELIANKESLTEHVIKQLHYLILKNIRDRDAGKYREVNVFITGSKHVPPMNSLVPPRMRELIDWLYSGEVKDLHSIEKVARFHHDFVYIHPFIDGNGRTGRLLMNLLLMQDGYPVAVIKTAKRHEYYKALEKASIDNDYTDIITLIAEEVENSLDLFIKALGIGEDKL